mmetsp:Transcript_11173/g.33503  ORF Transcript_11173/g.33503 Transcript_11173/m.33503 type:complete len:210 (+) Transcript_11173:2864-3493(+)
MTVSTWTRSSGSSRTSRAMASQAMAADWPQAITHRQSGVGDPIEPSVPATNQAKPSSNAPRRPVVSATFPTYSIAMPWGSNVGKREPRSNASGPRRSFREPFFRNAAAPATDPNAPSISAAPITAHCARWRVSCENVCGGSTPSRGSQQQDEQRVSPLVSCTRATTHGHTSYSVVERGTTHLGPPQPNVRLVWATHRAHHAATTLWLWE